MLNSIKKYFKKKTDKNSQDKHTGSSGSADGNVTYTAHSQYTDSFSPSLPRSWMGVDLDGTLARDDTLTSGDRIGEPVPEMLALVRKMINNGIRVKIFTARAQDPKQIPLIRKWLSANGLPELEITNVKDYNMQRLYDDRCIQVERNTGRLVTGR